MRKGSPPRVRGTDASNSSINDGIRITPACAGNSPRRSGWWRRPGDHPRVCGEQLLYMQSRKHKMGSPPRVRGTDRFVLCDTLSVGITPACAGNSRLGRRRAKPDQDHPRVCGEQGGPSQRGGLLLGSPPRVRGTDHYEHTIDFVERITPACAGNSG